MLNKFIFKNKNKITGIVQVGANLGQEIEFFQEHDIKNFILFEPINHIYDQLISKFSENKNIKIYNYALGNTNSSSFMNLSSNNDNKSSSLLEPGLHTQLFPEVEFKNKEKIEIKKLVDFDLKNINFLFLDTQGYELEVLKGTENKLEQFKFIFTEIARSSVFINGVLIQELDSFLYKKGFIRYKTYWASNKPTGDAIYIQMKIFNKTHNFYLFIKSKLTLSKIYIFLNFFKDLKKINYLLKKYAKRLLKK
tara:strand:- start:4779 stop:5531 length:753 start_codon:yes stop_codon:yes gene_type:complete